MLTLPLWVVTEHIKPTDPDHPAINEPGLAVAFDNAEGLFEFKKANKGGEWKIELADDRDGLVILIADLHRLNIASFTLNPEQDGSGGEQVELAELVEHAAKLGRDAKKP